MARTVDKVQHEDTKDRRHNQKDRMHLQTMVAVALLDCSHPSLDSVFSISFGDFGTKFLPFGFNIFLSQNWYKFVVGIVNETNTYLCFCEA